MTVSVRIQRKRTKGWRMPENTVYIGRSGPFGNPFYQRIGRGADEIGPAYEVRLYREWLLQPWGSQTWLLKLNATKNPAFATIKVARLAEQSSSILLGLDALRGQQLAHWCPLDQRCHADVLLELANR
jgi:hypothetical protein